MKSLMDYLSPKSWILAAIAGLFPFIILLKPSLFEFLVMLAVDLVALTLNKPLESAIFTRLYPDTKVYLKGVDYQAVERFSSAEKRALYQSFTLFPLRRARFCHRGSFIKVIPAFLVMIFYWKHEISNLAQAAILFGSALISFWFFYAAVFLESHIFLSKLIAELHEKYNFNEAFAESEVSYLKKEFLFQEVMNLILIIAFTLILQSVVILSGSYGNKWELTIKLAGIGLLGIGLFLRIWQLGRDFHFGALETLFQEMNGISTKKAHLALSLHTAPLLAQFEKTFNLLMQRLKVSEQELSSLVVYEADKGRYRALGEISALIAHDLSGPLHVAHYCSSQLLERAEDDKSRAYLQQLTTSVERALELIGTLRARLKNPKNGGTQASILEAHSTVVRFLETQFKWDLFRKVEFRFDPALKAMKFDLQSVDLIHIFENLYRNSVRNLLENSVQNPFISLELERDEPQHSILRVRDNGSGLSLERFEKLTAFRFAQQETTAIHEGLGLRLTRRLIELNQGYLHVVEPHDKDIGTVFQIKLKKQRNLGTERLNDQSFEIRI